MPDYYKAGKLPDQAYLDVHSGLRDSEIGVFSAWDARAIATNDQADIDRMLQMHEATYQRHDFTDYEGMYRKPWNAKEGQYAGNWSAGHYPNLFFLPYLITEEPKYLDAMEGIYAAYQKYRQKPISGPIIHQSGRELAWNLRTLAQLAWLQRSGRGVKHDYLSILEATRLHLLEQSQRPKQAVLHVVGIKINTDYSFTFWMESYIGQVLNYLLQLGFEDWRPLADWHFQQLVMRTDGTVPLKYLDADHGRAALTLDEYIFHNEERRAALESWNDNELPPFKIDGVIITYDIRAENALAWARAAKRNGLSGSVEAVSVISNAIDQRGWGYNHQEFALRADS